MSVGLVVCRFACLFVFICLLCSFNLFVVRVCSTSPPGGNQVDGLPPAPVILNALWYGGRLFRELWRGARKKKPIFEQNLLSRMIQELTKLLGDRSVISIVVWLSDYRANSEVERK